MVRRRCHHARGSRPISQAVPRTVTPSSVTRRANSLPCRVTRICSSPVTRLSSRLSNQAWFCPPRHSRPESTCKTRISLYDSGEHAAQRVEFERLLQKGASQLFEELQRVAADGIAGGEDDPIGDGRVHARERVKHLTPTEAGHAQIADDQIEWLHECAFQRLAAVPREHDLMAPALECCLHVMKNVRLVIYDEYPQPFRPFSRHHRHPALHPRLGSRRA